MSAHTANSQFVFKLPTMSYIDAKWEEPDLRVRAGTQDARKSGGLAAWLSRRLAALRAWRLDRVAATELSIMSDRELLDIGLSRSDISRAFTPFFNADLRHRGEGV